MFRLMVIIINMMAVSIFGGNTIGNSVFDVIEERLLLKENEKSFDKENENTNIDDSGNENTNSDEVNNTDSEEVDVEEEVDNKKESTEKEETSKNNETTSSSNKKEENKTTNKVEDNKQDDKTTSKKEENTTTSSKTEVNTQKNEETTSKSEEPKEEAKPAAKTLVSTETKTEDEESYKYGVKIITTKTYKVSSYSDGSIDKKETGSKVTYDKSTFSATTEELKNEAANVASKNKAVYQEVLSYVNTYRSEVNRNALVLDDELSVIATIRAIEMAWSGKFDHKRPNGSDWNSVLDEMNYWTSMGGENIAYNYRTAAAVSEGWKNSPGHYENMTRESFNKIGIGMFELKGEKYWVQLFAN